MNRCVLPIVFIYAFFNTAVAQNRAIDSLKHLLSTASGKEKVDLTLRVGVAYLDVDDPRSLEWFDKALMIAQDSLQIVKGNRLKAVALSLFYQWEESIRLVERTLPIAERNNYKKEEAGLLNNIANYKTFTGDYRNAIRLIYRSLQLKQELGEKLDISTGYNNVGLIFYKLRAYEKALLYFSKSLQLKQGEASTQAIEMVKINIGLCLINLGEYEEGMQILKKIFGGKPSFPVGGNFAMGMAYLGLKKFDSARTYFLRSLENAGLENDKRFQAENYVYLSKVYQGIGNYKKSLQCLEKSLLLAKEHHLEEIVLDGYRQYVNSYKIIDNPAKLIEYQTKFIQQKRKLYSANLAQALALCEAEQIEKELAKSIELQKRKVNAKEESLRLHKTLQHAILIVGLLLCILAFSLAKMIFDRIRFARVLAQIVKERKDYLEYRIAVLMQVDLRSDSDLVKWKDILNDRLNNLKSLKSLRRFGGYEHSV
jgi:tetratricopeptide (TPR) repeat protein